MSHAEFIKLIAYINKKYDVEYLAVQMKTREFVMPISLFVPISIEGINTIEDHAKKAKIYTYN